MLFPFFWFIWVKTNQNHTENHGTVLPNAGEGPQVPWATAAGFHRDGGVQHVAVQQVGVVDGPGISPQTVQRGPKNRKMRWKKTSMKKQPWNWSVLWRLKWHRLETTELLCLGYQARPIANQTLWPAWARSIRVAQHSFYIYETRPENGKQLQSSHSCCFIF